MDDKVRESLNAAIVAAAGKADNADDIVALVGAAISMPDKLTWRDHVRAIKTACNAASTCGPECKLHDWCKSALPDGVPAKPPGSWVC